MKHSIVFSAISLAIVLLISSSVVTGTSLAQNSSGGPGSSWQAPAGNVVFNGSVSENFPAASLLYTNYHTSPWGPYNNITSLYLAYNSTYLFIGITSVYSGNSLMVFISNETGSSQGTYNFHNLNVWSRAISFTTPVNVFFANYADGPSQAYRITSSTGQSNTTPNAEPVANITYYSSGNQEIAIPLSAIFQDSFGNLTFGISAFIVGNSGSWVGIGAPFYQKGQYNDGSSQATFTVNNTFQVTINRKETKPVSIPIYLNIIYNDHQPLYSPVGLNYWMLPWTDVHLEEYAEQALIISQFPDVNVTYSLSGSLLYQIDAIRSGFYNNSYIMAAYIPESQWNNTVYYEVNHYHDDFLSSFAERYQWNTTTVRQILENDLAFNSPSWVYSSGTPAGNEYAYLFSLYQKGINLTNSQLTNALVEFFLWSVSYPIISGQLGSQYRNDTLLPLYNESNFSISDIGTIIRYYPVEAGLVINEFRKDSDRYGGNVELMTTPFDHPILPLLLQYNWTDENGVNITKGTWGTDVQAQLSLGRGIFYRNFGYYPTGQWTPEQAVSQQIIPYLNASGVQWTSTDQAVLSEAGVLTGTQGTVPYDSALYQPYLVTFDNRSVYMYFRDSTLSNDWGFNYGNIAHQDGSWAAVDQFMGYLKNVYNSVPMSSHNNTVVTVAIDGENWMFESPFPEDAVPFLTDLYTALSQNSTLVRTVTGDQYLRENHTHGVLEGLPTGSWNYQGPAGSVSPYLTQWAGHPTQDATWEQLAIVRKEVMQYGKSHNLTQPTNYSQIFMYNDYPFLYSFNLSSEQGRYTAAWLAIYAAEGSDIYFSFDPGDQNLYAQNDIVFEHEVRQDMKFALNVLGIPLTPFLEAHWEEPVQPTSLGDQASNTPAFNGMMTRSYEYSKMIAYSVSSNNNWAGSTFYNFTQGKIRSVFYEFNSTYLFIGIQARGSPRPLADHGVSIYFSNENSGPGDLVGLGVPGAMYATLSGRILPFASEEGFTFQSYERGIGENLSMYRADNSSSWVYSGNSGRGIFNSIIEIEIPLSSIQVTPGNSIEFQVSTHHGRDFLGPFKVSLPLSLARFRQISSIYNPSPSNGPGYYVYPLLKSDYPPGSVHMEWVNVSVYESMVRFSFTFRNLSNPFGGQYGFTQPIIDIYIHTSNSSMGSTDLLPGVNAMATANFDWQWVIQADGFPGNAYIENYTGALYDQLSITSNLTSKVVNVTVPMSLIGYNITSYGYIIVAGFQDGYATNGWDPVLEQPTDYQGGGARGPYAPNIFSYIAPDTVNPESGLSQQAILSNYTSSSYAKLPGIYLPHFLAASAVPSVSRPQDVTADFMNGIFHSFYSENGLIYESNSSNGRLWSSPNALMKAPTGMIGMVAVHSGWSVQLILYNHSSVIIYNQASMHLIASYHSSGIMSVTPLFHLGREFFLISYRSHMTLVNSAFTVLNVIYISSTDASAYMLGNLLVVSYAQPGYLNMTYFLSLRQGFLLQISTFTISSGGSYSNLSMAQARGQILLAYQKDSTSGSNIYIFSPYLGIFKMTSDGTAHDLYIGTASGFIFMDFVDYQNSWQNLFSFPQIGYMIPLWSSPMDISPSPGTATILY